MDVNESPVDLYHSQMHESVECYEKFSQVQFARRIIEKGDIGRLMQLKCFQLYGSIRTIAVITVGLIP
jgi:hypothetical protein